VSLLKGENKQVTYELKAIGYVLSTQFWSDCQFSTKTTGDSG